MKRRDTVREIDEVAQQFRRAPDRPDGRILRPRLENQILKKAHQRLRTAAWRSKNDTIGRPSSEVLAKALLLAICTSPNFQNLLDDDLSIVRETCNTLVERGFALKEIHHVMRKLRARHIGPAGV